MYRIRLLVRYQSVFCLFYWGLEVVGSNAAAPEIYAGLLRYPIHSRKQIFAMQKRTGHEQTYPTPCLRLGLRLRALVDSDL
jgi:hypothetical protein